MVTRTHSRKLVGSLKSRGKRVRQIEAKAVRKLQNPVRSKKLEGFVDLEIIQQMAERAQQQAQVSAETEQKERDAAANEVPAEKPLSLFDESWDTPEQEPVQLMNHEFVDDDFARAA